jgi:hypothetical protein
VVAEAFEVAGDQDHAAGPLQRPVVLGGPLDLPEDLGVEAVQGLVEDGQALGQLDVAPRERGHGGGDHPLGVPPHLGEGGLDLRDRRVVLGDADELGHVDAQVAHPLDVGVDVQHAGDQPEVLRHRSLQRQRPQDLLLNLDVDVVDLVVANDHLVGEDGVERGERLERPVELALHELAHLEQLRLEPLEALFKGGAHGLILRASRTPRGPAGVRQGNGR